MSEYDLSYHNKWFHFLQNKEYNNDRCLYRDLLSEANNIYGNPMIYYIVSYDTTYDPLFGEDDNRRIARKFPIKAVFELPKEMEQYDSFGIHGLDEFPMYVSKPHFINASKYDVDGTLYPVTSGASTSAYNSYIPKAGDIMRSQYNNKYYELLDVGEEEEMFLQQKHSWVLTVRTLKDEHIGLSATTSASMGEITSAVLDKEDIYQQNDYISSAEDDVLYSSGAGEESSNQDPLGGW